MADQIINRSMNNLAKETISFLSAKEKLSLILESE